MKYFEVSANGRKYQLRLTIGGQKNLKAAFDKDAVDVIMDAISNPNVLSALLSESLRFPGNNNPVEMTGEELYDALVDEGYAGQACWANLALKIAEHAGIISTQQRVALVKKVERLMDGLFGEEDTENPNKLPEENH